MRTVIHIGGIIRVSGFDVLLNTDAVDVDHEHFISAARKGFGILKECETYRNAACGGMGPLAELGDIDYDQYLDVIGKARSGSRSIEAKRRLTKKRRQEFALKRRALALMMLNSGVEYVCSHPECEQSDYLTIDHIIPISKGGTDDIGNLQFLCRSHNSQKCDEIPTI